MTHKNCFALLFLIIVFHSTCVSAQTNSLKLNNLYVGYGFIPLEQTSRDYDSNNQNNKDKTTGPLYFKYEHIFFGNLGVGLNVAWSKYHYTYSYLYYNYPSYLNETYSQTFSTYSVLLKMNYHFGDAEKFPHMDPYVGTGVGYRNENYRIETTGGYYYYFPNPVSESDGKIGFEFTGGFRYLFTPSLGLYMEAGFAKSIFQAGGTFSF